MAAAVELLPGGRVGEPEVGAAVDDHHLVAELGRDRAGLAVRQREEDHVVAGERLGGGLLEDPVGQRDQVRLEAAEASRRRWCRAVRAPISTSGWPSSRRSSSPPAYPLAPATATRELVMCMTIQITACSSYGIALGGCAVGGSR